MANNGSQELSFNDAKQTNSKIFNFIFYPQFAQNLNFKCSSHERERAKSRL